MRICELIYSDSTVATMMMGECEECAGAAGACWELGPVAGVCPGGDPCLCEIYFPPIMQDRLRLSSLNPLDGVNLVSHNLT